MNRTLRKTLILLVAFAVVAGLLYHSRRAIGLEGFRWDRFREAVAGARLDLLLLSLGAIYVCYFLRALRWCRFTRYLGPSSVWRVFAATLMGFAAIFLLGRAGEPVRPLLIARKEKLPATAMFGTYVVERVFDMATTIIMASLSLVFLPALIASKPATTEATGSSNFLPVLQKAGFALLIGLVGLVAFLIYLRVTEGGAVVRALERGQAESGWKRKVAGVFRGFVEGLHAIRTWGDLGAAVVYTAVHWMLVVLIYHWVPLAFSGRFTQVDLRASVVVLACTMLGSTLQLPGVGGGSQLGCFLAMTQFLGAGTELAAAAAVMLWLVTFCGCSLAGIPLLLTEGMSYGELRRIAEQRDQSAAAPEAGVSRGTPT